MRIIAGRFKGQKLCSFSASFIRPMTDRVRTSLFDTLYSNGLAPMNKRVLDLFAGTGSLAFEALSRGAKEVTLVEENKKAIHIIKKNQAKLKINSGLKVYHKDVFRFLSSYRAQPFDLVFADPPFKKQYGEKVLSASANSLALKTGTMLFLELSIKEDPPEKSSFYQLTNKKKFGDKKILFYQFL